MLPFSFLVILFSVKLFHRFRSKNIEIVPFLILNVIIFSTLFTYILIGGLSVSVSCFLVIYSKKLWISDFSFHLEANILNLLFFIFSDVFIFFHARQMPRLDKTTYLSLLHLIWRIKQWCMKIRCFTISRIHKYSIYFVLYLYWIHYILIYFFSNFFCLIERTSCRIFNRTVSPIWKNTWFDGFHLVIFQIYYLILLMQMLLVIFEAFLSVWIFYVLSPALFLIEIFHF